LHVQICTMRCSSSSCRIADVAEHEEIVFCLSQGLVVLAELQHTLQQQLQALEDRKLALAERKLSQQRRVVSRMDAELKQATAQTDACEAEVIDLLREVNGQLCRCSGALL
jgi:hypothetical protein